MSEFPDATVGYLMDKIERYERLIRWLAKTYGDNDPTFHFVSIYGNELNENKELYETWMEVVRNESQVK